MLFVRVYGLNQLYSISVGTLSVLLNKISPCIREESLQFINLSIDQRLIDEILLTCSDGKLLVFRRSSSDIFYQNTIFDSTDGCENKEESFFVSYALRLRENLSAETLYGTSLDSTPSRDAVGMGAREDRKTTFRSLVSR